MNISLPYRELTTAHINVSACECTHMWVYKQKPLGKTMNISTNGFTVKQFVANKYEW